MREDEIVFSFDLAHQEGQIPTLSVDVKNPHIGLLAPGRKQWVWFSYAGAGVVGTVPLFYGRLVGLPSNLLGETITLQFLARPTDFLAQKQAIANSLMVEPYYDQIWIDQTRWGDPDTVLETYAMQWHVDRLSHVVSVSDILIGEDGTEEFLPEEAFYDSVEIEFAQSPQTQVVFDGTVQWTQTATGVIPLPDVGLIAWNGEQIINDWPKTGDQLGSGWSAEFAAITNWSDQFGGGNTAVIQLGGGTIGGGTSVQPKPPGIPDTPGGTITAPRTSPTKSAMTYNWTFRDISTYHRNGDCLSANMSVTYNEWGLLAGNIVPGTISFNATFGDPSTGQAASISFSASYSMMVGERQQTPTTATIITDGGGETVGVPSLFGQLTLRYNLEWGRTETINFVMNSDIQPIVLLPPDEAVNQIKLSMHGSDVGLPIDPGGLMPIGDPSRSAFFPTTRGQLAMQYPMLVARANLAQSARAVKINFDCTFEKAIGLSCRKNALLHDPRLPGGSVVGKITEYHLKADGDDGTLAGQVQIESVIGKGTSSSASEGMPTYVDAGYVFVGYQFYSDAVILLPTGDANIVMPPTYLPDAPTLPLTFETAVTAFQIHTGTPVDVVRAGGAATIDPTWLEIVLIPVTNQKFSTKYDLGLSTLVLPKLIDLAAPYA